MADFFADIDWARWAEEFWTSGARIIGVIVVAYVGLYILRRALEPAIERVIEEQMEGQPQAEIEKRVETLVRVIYRTAWVVAIVVVALTALPELGINTGALLAGAGLAGLAIGFGAQSLVKDILGGLFILVENQFAQGDIVDLDGTIGEVIDVNLRRTVLRDLDGTVHSIPHGVPETTSNLTKSFSRVNINVGVSYSEDLNHVYEVINRTGREIAEDPDWQSRVLSPPMVLGLDEFGDSALAIRVLGDTVAMEQWNVVREFRKRLKEAFDREGIEIPYPHRTLVSTGAKANEGGLLLRHAGNGASAPEAV